MVQISDSYVDTVAFTTRAIEQELSVFYLKAGNSNKAMALTEGVKNTNSIIIEAIDDQPAPTDAIVQDDFMKRRETAVCAEIDPEIFFPEKGGSTKLAKKICRDSCELTEECLNYALKNHERFGIWGGLSERERRKVSLPTTG